MLPQTVTGAVSAWLFSMLLTYPVRATIAHRMGGFHHAKFASVSGLDLWTLFAAMLSSTLVFLLAILILKYELLERGEAPEVACYSWHVATLYLGCGFATACAHDRLPPPIRTPTCLGDIKAKACLGKSIAFHICVDDKGLYRARTSGRLIVVEFLICQI